MPPPARPRRATKAWCRGPRSNSWRSNRSLKAQRAGSVAHREPEELLAPVAGVIAAAQPSRGRSRSRASPFSTSSTRTPLGRGPELPGTSLSGAEQCGRR